MNGTKHTLRHRAAGRRGFARLAVFLAVWLIDASMAFAQGEQWLTYRTSASPETVVGRTTGQEIKLTASAPKGTAMPKFAAPDPLFGTWRTPMAPGGLLWLALDRSTADGAHDRLFIDTDADGSLADEAAIPAGQARAHKGRETALFRQVKVLLAGEDGPIEFHLNLSFRMASAQSTHLVATAAGWYEGTIDVDGKKRRLTLFDANANGAFDDAFLDFQNSDRIKIAAGTTLVFGKVGRYLQVDRALYRFEVSPDGAFVRLSRVDEDALATIELSRDVQEISVGGENGLLFLPVADGLVRLPAGKYRVNHWALQRKDSARNTWRLVAAAPFEAAVFEVGSGKRVTLDVGDPVISSVSGSRSGSTYRFSEPTFSGRNGERLTITRNGERPPTPRLRIRNADGSYDSVFAFEYG